jgi:hypothetical protein
MKESKRLIDATTAAIKSVLSATKEKKVTTIAKNLRSGFARPPPILTRQIVTDRATAPTAIMIVRMRKRIGGIGFTLRSHQLFAAVASMIVAAGDRPGRRIVETNPVPSSVSKPREAENREKPNSGQRVNASSSSADRFQTASNQETAPTWSDFLGSRQAGSHQLQGIGPYNGGRVVQPPEVGNNRG